MKGILWLLGLLVLAPGRAPAERAPDDDIVTTRVRGPAPDTDRDPEISIWTGSDDVIRRGQRVRVFFETTANAYVSVFRIDTDGGLTVLFPLGPWDHGFARGGRRYEVRPHASRFAFTADGPAGEGYVFAVASVVPFDFHNLSDGPHWDLSRFGRDGRVIGDPYDAAMAVMDLISPIGGLYPGYDIAPYWVERQVAYPRFVCYECHANPAYAGWDPYADACYDFRIVIYDDPEYYPARIRSGNRVVFNRTKRLEPRFVFVERGSSEPSVEVRRRRPDNAEPRRRVVEREPTSVRRRSPERRSSTVRPAGPRRIQPRRATRPPRRVTRPPDTSGIQNRRRSG